MLQNRLAQETSPYLLQHKDNPVAWQPWDARALEQARTQNKPILLSVGYAACHWCHVMEHESFEDPETARLMNQAFIPIKVDREERPDLDAIYQNALALLGQHGGWPLTMFLTPRGEPFWGGTYFPNEARYGRPAFRDVLTGVARAWHDQPETVRHNVETLGSALARLTHAAPGHAVDMAILDQAADWLADATDPARGGLAGAPKFPQPFVWELLWRSWLRGGNARHRDCVIQTLDHMAFGGIWDHLGGGFCRYATDEAWLVPHFEKMLYDNAQLVDLYTLAWQGTRRSLYAERVEETIEWALRDMVTEGGAFAASLDADSEGEEGRFYTWTVDEIERLLPAEELDAFRHAYDVPAGGNWEGRIVLSRNKPQPLAGVQFERKLAAARRRLFEAREKRPHPGRDDKVLADWNGLMIAALANAALAFGVERWRRAAELAFHAITSRMTRLDGRLGHSYRAGRLQEAAMLEDYAALCRAALALYELGGDSDYVDVARRWTEIANDLYWDVDHGGYFLTASDASDLITRPKTAVDPSTPSGNGMMVQVLARLYALTGEVGYRDRADSVVAAFSGELDRMFPNMATLLNGLDSLAYPVQVVVMGPLEDETTRALWRAVGEAPIPGRMVIPVPPGGDLPAGHPAHGKTMVNGSATVYVCRNGTCSPPVTAVNQVKGMLGAPG